MKQRILVVDDEEIVRDSLRALLASEGYEVETAESGEEGVKWVRWAFFHLVLLDLKMPGMGGLEALRYIKAHDPGLPVVMFTGFSSVEDAKEALRLGAADYLCKPLEPAALLEAARQYMRTAPPALAEKVLVVDDDPMFLQSCLAVLEAGGIQAEGFLRGEEAIRQAARGVGQVILTDLRLPDVDGLRLISRVREMRPDIVSLLFTGYPSVESAVKAMQQGVFDYLAKPIEPEQFLDTVRRALEKSRREHLPGGFRAGRAYGLVERDRAKGIFNTLVARGFVGLWVSRDPPREGREVEPGVSVYRMGDLDGTQPPSIPPVPERLIELAQEFCRRKGTVLLLDGLELLSTRVGFEAAYRVVSTLRDTAAATHSILLVLFHPPAFTERERGLLGRELDLEPKAEATGTDKRRPRGAAAARRPAAHSHPSPAEGTAE